MKRQSVAAVLALMVLVQLGAALGGNRGWKVEVEDKKSAMAHAQARKATHAGDLKKQASEVSEWWADYKEFFNKQYATPAEEARAFHNFKVSMERVEAVNSDPGVMHWASGNEFSDLDFPTFAKKFLTVRPPKPTNSRKLLSAANTQQIQQEVTDQGFELLEAAGPVGIPVVRHRNLLALPTAVNWTKSGKVTKVKNQGGCGSCWAFAATSTIESAYLLAYGKSASSFNIDLSEQQITSCSTGSGGCNGGGSNDAIDFVYRFNQTLEKQWPYTNINGGPTSACYGATKYAAATKPGNVIKLASSYFMPQGGNYTALQAAVAKQPVVVYVAVDSAFQNYAGGVFKSTATGINHAVVVTGYNVTARTWSIKNSWGSYWGEKGYIRTYMDFGTAGVASMYRYAFFPPLKFSKNFSNTTIAAIAAGTM